MKTKYNGTREEDNIAELGDEFFKSAKRIGRPVSENPKSVSQLGFLLSWLISFVLLVTKVGILD